MPAEPRKREGQQLLLRFAEGSDLRDRLDEIARANNRSLTAEILHRLEASLSDEGDARSKLAAQRLMRGPGDPLEKRVSELEDRLAAVEKLLTR